MKSLLSLGLIFFVFSFCGLSEKLKDITGDTSSNSSSGSNTASAPSKPTKSDDSVEKPELTATQQAIQDGGTEITWDDQGISWKLPTSWKKMSSTKLMLNYGSPDNAFLIASVSPLPNAVTPEISLKATYESSLEQLKQGKYEKVRYVEIDGVKGVEWWEAPTEDKGDPRRFQWIAFRNYQGQNQQLNIMLSTQSRNFDKHSDDFPAVMYSMKIPKG